MNNSRKRDWRIPDQSSPLQSLIRNSSKVNVTMAGLKQTISTIPTTNINSSPSNSSLNGNKNVSFNNNKTLKEVPKPTSLGTFAIVLLMHICRRVLFFNLNIRVGIYILFTFLVSLITDHFPLPASPYLTDPRSYFNFYLVSVAWVWTCTLVAIFIYFSSSVYCCGKFINVNQHLCRLGIAALWWYGCTKFFDFVRYNYGICLSTTSSNRSNSPQGSKLKTNCPTGHWLPFSISDQSFLLVHCVMVIVEETKAFMNWDRIQEWIAKEEQQIASIHSASKANKEEIETIKELYACYTPRIKLLIITLTILVLIWDVALFFTLVYFQNLAQKLTGVILALAFWVFSYKFWFKGRIGQLDKVNPGLPGYGLVRYIKMN